MKSIEKFCRFFGIIKVRQNGNMIRITGIDGLIMRKYFKGLFETDAISKQMFTSVTDTAIIFNQFFVPDFLYMLKVFRESSKCGWSGKRTIDKIVHGIENDTWWKVTKQPVTSMIDDTQLKQLKWTPMPKQMEFLHLYGHNIPKYDLRGYLLAAAPGTGKFQPLDSPVRTPTGWTRMGDIKVGSIVTTPDGGTAPVTAIYPQGEQSIYRITFEDGRSTECGDDHLWKITNRHWNPRGEETWRVVTLKEIRLHNELYGLGTNNRLYVQLIEPEIKEDIELPIDPYLLGALLGDGHIGKGQIEFANVDEFIVEEVRRLLPEDCSLRRKSLKHYQIVKKSKDHWQKPTSLMEKLRELKLSGKLSYAKFIPDIYMQGSFSQKLSLIQGLMDTDGTADKKTGSPSFCSTSLTMAKQVQELIRGMGGLAKISTRTPTYTHKGIKKQGRLAYQVSIRHKDSSSLFRLPRKKDLSPKAYQYKDTLKLRIRDIEYIGKKEAQCIAVDHPDHLYITDDYIVTHNTFMDLMVATCVIPKEIAEVKIIISPKKAIHLVWEKSVSAVFKKPPSCWVSDSGAKMPLDGIEYYVFNFEKLDMAIELGHYLKSKNIRYFVIVDESHNFADARSNRTQKLVKLQTIRDDIYFIWASGSPILKLASELISFLKCSDPRFDDDAERRFKRIYSSSPGRANQIFNNRLGQMMAFLVAKSEVSTTKPTIIELPVKLPSSLAHKYLMSTVREEMRAFIADRLVFYKDNIKQYREVVDKWMKFHEHQLKSRTERQAFNEYQKNLKMIMQAPDLMLAKVTGDARAYELTKLFPSIPPVERKAFRNALSAVKNIKLKVRGEALGTVLSKRRSECAADLGIYCKPDQIMNESLSKTLFFASSVLPVVRLEKFLKEKGFEPLAVYADTNANLTANIEAFTNDPNINPICATMQSLSEAVPVIAASTVVLLNRPFRQATWDQVIARADRLGQVHPVTVIEVTLDTGDEPNVSSTTDAILTGVRELINAMMGSDFAGPDPDERVYKDLIDASNEDPAALEYTKKSDL